MWPSNRLLVPITKLDKHTLKMIRLGQDRFYFQILYKVEFLVSVWFDFFDRNYEQK